MSPPHDPTRLLRCLNPAFSQSWATRHEVLIKSVTMLVSPVWHFNGKKNRTSIVQAQQVVLGGQASDPTPVLFGPDTPASSLGQP